ncbi:MAG: thiamine pyrophosphate-binding protein [Rhodospirillales bacterium]|nr:MAG: thiamine pyrophosphate-binding protein [Rhodospirillales bacterium]
MAKATTVKRTGAEILIDALLGHGVERAFGVPGESYLAALDALYGARNRIAFTICRQEGGAAYMAEAWGKLTGRPGICFVTRGPGATNAAIGVHAAMQDSTPMILMVGQVARDQADREAFQEIDYTRMFAPLAKWVAQIEDAARIPEYVSRAFHTALSGRPGPVVLALPEDMLRDSATAIDVAMATPVRPSPARGQMTALRTLLEKAQRPLMIVGGGGWTAQASVDIQAYAKANNLPTGAAFRRQDCFDNHDPRYVGHIGIGINPALGKRLLDADLIIAVGPRLGEITTVGYTLLQPPVPAQTLVHVHPDPNELNSVFRADLAIAAGPAEFAALARSTKRVDHAAWDDWAGAARADYLKHGEPVQMSGELQLAEIVAWMNEVLPDDAIVTNGAGNYSIWLHRFFRWRHFGTQAAPTLGSMGYGVPAAVAAKLAAPERTVVSFNGDGCFLMNGQELATAVQYGANAIFLVVNNGMYGTIRMHQERTYPGRVFGTELVNPDFAALARAYGANGEVVTRTAEFKPAFERALAADRPSLIELRIEPEAITPTTTLTALRRQAEAG